MIPALISIKVENLTVAKPVRDVAAATAASTDSTYYVESTEWKAADGTTLAIGDTFHSRTVYTVNITLKTAGTDVFSEKSTYNDIEGKTAAVNPVLTGDAHADSVILTYIFASTGGSAGGGGGGTSRYTVSFESNGGSKVSSQTVTRNSVMKEPTAPTKENFDFDGWYSDKELKTKYDFSAKVTKSFTLYAKWTEKDNSVNQIILTIGKKDAQVFGKAKSIDRLVITAKDYDDFLRLMQEAGYEIKTGKYISFRAEGQERFTRSKTIGENYTEERIKERIAGRTPRRSQRQTTPKGISLIGDIQERIRLIDSKGYEYKAKLTILKEAARTLNYLTENNLLQYVDLEKKVEDVHSSYDRTGKELKGVEARLREVQPLIKNISNYQRLKPVYDAFQRAKDKPSFKAKHEAELVIFEAARSTLLAMQGDEKLPSLKTLQAEQQRLLEEQQRLYDERARLKKEARMIDTLKANVDDFLKSATSRDQEKDWTAHLE